jgi:hypothetical protein
MLQTARSKQHAGLVLTADEQAALEEYRRELEDATKPAANVLRRSQSCQFGSSERPPLDRRAREVRHAMEVERKRIEAHMIEQATQDDEESARLEAEAQARAEAEAKAAA